MQAVRSGIFIALLFGMVGLAQARGSVPITDPENNPVVSSDNKELSIEAVGQAIRAAGASQGYPWTASGDQPGKLQLTTLVRNKHTVVVDVTYDAKTYSIRYANSVNMNYKVSSGKALIHPNYNVWVSELKQAIDAELRKL
ncbi:MAG: hypothetical protein ABL989_04145 [Gammaproteobacteria bacterium]